jgi:pimeloyl-ACP methyl ester carboxylesterase
VSDVQYTESEGAAIAYRVFGESDLNLVLVPGFVSNVEVMWEEPRTARFLDRLTSVARVISFDKRGQGLSDRLGWPPTLEESMADVLAVMDAADCERAALFGISEGGPMSMLTAATHPDRVSALAIYGTFARLLRADDYPEGLPEDAFATWCDRLMEQWGEPALLEMWAPSECDDRAFARWWAKLLRQGSSPRGAVELMQLYRELDVRQVLPAIGVPTLVLHRRDDAMIRPRQARHLADNIPGARYVELDGADHLPMAGDQDALLDELEEFLVGTRRAREPDRALATVVFTDIVDSTRRAAELGDRRWRDVMTDHATTVRRALHAHGGREVKATGDGFLALFDAPGRAIRFARAASLEATGTGVEIRAGLHTGEIELLGDDVAGLAVNIAARVMERAGAGEVLVSSTVRELVVGSGVRFEPRGQHELKGVPERWALFAAA